MWPAASFSCSLLFLWVLPSAVEVPGIEPMPSCTTRRIPDIMLTPSYHHTAAAILASLSLHTTLGEHSSLTTLLPNYSTNLQSVVILTLTWISSIPLLVIILSVCALLREYISVLHRAIFVCSSHLQQPHSPSLFLLSTKRENLYQRVLCVFGSSQ